MTQRLDENDYSDEETITIKIPFNLPYREDRQVFERIHGDFQHDGEFYKLIKQKVENDTLYIVCIQDKKEKKIFGFMADMVKLSTDIPTSSSSIKLLNSLIKDYVSVIPMIIVSSQRWPFDLVYDEQHFNLLVKNYPVFSPPPKFLS
jgi:hypothetical protein